MTILAIETSCDETALALVSHGNGDNKRPEIIAELIASQVSLHALYGGVVPEIAAREHLKTLPILTDSLLKQHSELLRRSPLTLAAVTAGPGLKGSLLMGVSFAKGFALANSVECCAVNHIEAHLLSPLMSHPTLNFPYLGLVVSGGHTELHLVKGIGEYQLIERTTDDAAGEAFDKSAALLGIPYPGGAELSRLASGVDRSRLASREGQEYTVAASKTGFSFSGLKTSFRFLLERRKRSGLPIDTELACAAVEAAIVSTIKARVIAAIDATGVHSVGLAGGVAANRILRSELQGVANVFATDLKWCGDNGAMIGFLAAMRHGSGLRTPLYETQARWSVEEMNWSV
jgi:N6-L-threonylcarbamoyladenine synthase